MLPVARPAIYLDSNAGSPLRPEVIALVDSLLRGAGENGAGFAANPSSIHSHGRKAKRVVADAREKIAHSLSRGVPGSKIDPEQLIFTSSGSEANQLAIRSVLEPKLARGEKPHWITTPVEHDSVGQMRAWLEARGGSVSLLPVDENGAPTVSRLADLWRPDTALVSVVWVNNETGVLSDVAALAAEVRARKGLLHLDGAQAWGKLAIDAGLADLATFSAHKIGALPGLGVLYVRPGVAVSPLILGKQEKGRRGGTESVIAIAAAGAAAETLEPAKWADQIAPLRDRLEAAIEARIPGTVVNGRGASRVANTLNLSFEGTEGEGMVLALDLAGYSVSSGSACSSGVLEPSHVLLAMGRTKAEAMAAIRVSLSSPIGWEALEGFVDVLAATVTRLREAGEKAKLKLYSNSNSTQSQTPTDLRQ